MTQLITKWGRGGERKTEKQRDRERLTDRVRDGVRETESILLVYCADLSSMG